MSCIHKIKGVLKLSSDKISSSKLGWVDIFFKLLSFSAFLSFETFVTDNNWEKFQNDETDNSSGKDLKWNWNEKMQKWAVYDDDDNCDNNNNNDIAKSFCGLKFRRIHLFFASKQEFIQFRRELDWSNFELF